MRTNICLHENCTSDEDRRWFVCDDCGENARRIYICPNAPQDVWTVCSVPVPVTGVDLSLERIWGESGYITCPMCDGMGFITDDRER